MASIGSLTVDLAMEAANFITASKNAAEASESMAKRIEAAMDLAKEATTAFVGAWSVERVAEMINQSVEFGAKMIDLSAKTGASTTAIQEFTFAMKQNGGSSEGAEAAINKFSKSLGSAQDGNQKMSKVLASIGVQSWKSYDDALSKVMEGLGKLPSTTEKNSVATQLFGKSASAVAAIASKGADAYAELAKEAESYGIVLDKEVLQKGKEAEDKISALKQVLAADISNAVLTNADAIAKFADGLIHLVELIPTVINELGKIQTYFAELNLELPAWMKSGISFEGGKMHLSGAKEADLQSEHIALGTHDGRDYLYHKFKKDSEDAYKSGDSAKGKELHDKAQWTANYDAQMGRQKPTMPTGEGGGGKITPPKQKKTKDHDGTDSYLKASEQYDKQINSAKLGLATSAEERFRLETQAIDMEKADKDAEIDANKKWTDTQKDALHAQNDALTALKKEAAAREEGDAYIQETLDIELQKRGFQEDQLKSDQEIAKTQAERRRLALELLDLEYKDKNASLQAIIDKQGTTVADRDKAIREQDNLKKSYANDVRNMKQQTQSPLEAYMDQITMNADQMNEALQGVDVKGLQSLGDGILGVVKGTETLGQAFSSMAESIIEDIAKIAIEQTLLAPLAGLFGGGGGLLGGLFGGSNFAAPTSIGVPGFSIPISGARANGGMTDPGTYLVGERGPELVNIGSNANVTTNRQLQGSANDNSGPVYNFGPITSNDPEAVRSMVVQTLASAMPVITKQSTDRTLKQASRRTL